MKIAIFDPKPRHDYLTTMFFDPMLEYASRNNIPVIITCAGGDIKGHTVCCLADLLTLDFVNRLKENGNKIIGFSVTDSSYISQSCREAAVLSKIDLMFMLTGIQRVNYGHEFVVDKDFNIVLEKRQFLPDEDWTAFNMMRISGRLKSLPYVHWERQPHVEAKPYNLRSQKALIRGGHHMRRFILALKLMEIDRLDTNSGFVTSPYFQDDMNPQFRYCDKCRETFKRHKMFPFQNQVLGMACTNPMWKNEIDMSDLGQWNNRCPESFYAVASAFRAEMHSVEKLMNARWMTQEDHLKMLARITFTADCKWLFSIYAAQRFWDAAMVGCINFLPSRTADQDYFPEMHPDIHYLTFEEDMQGLDWQARITEREYVNISKSAKALYDEFMKPTDYTIGTPILKYIFDNIQTIQ